MSNFQFSQLSRFFCCHPSHFERSELFCSSLLSKYIGSRQNGPELLPNNAPVDVGSTEYQPRPTSFAPYYYGDIASYQHPQLANTYLTNAEATTRVYAIMDGLRVQLKNPGRSANSLRSPNIHRSDDFTVSLRGWLYRLEGAALKQWKRRWFVLADYVLFYYKDMGEEKMLGSLLLPSYRISPCLNGDGISRKFAFKAEHSNMKSYYFAADSKEMQQQWMNALSLASIMQLSILCPGKGGNAKGNSNYPSANVRQLSPNKQLMDGSQAQQQFLVGNKDEAAILAYEAKRLEGNSSAILYGGAGYYASNLPGASLNLYNSVGLPAVCPEQMYPYNHAFAPPKPQRQQYYDPMMTYDMPVPNEYKFNGVDMQPGGVNYYLDQYDPLYLENGISLQYPEYIEPAEFATGYPPEYFQRLPPRPHSADFLERNQDDDFDEECQNAFQKADKSAFLESAPNLAPKILPSRPKSSIARYEPMYNGRLDSARVSDCPISSYSSSKPAEKATGLPSKSSYSASNNLSQYFLYKNGLHSNEQKPIKDANQPQDVSEMNSQILSSYCRNDGSANGTAAVPVRPPLPHEYATKFGQLSGVDLESDHSHSRTSSCRKIIAKSNFAGKTETSYTSDDENGSLTKGNSAIHAKSIAEQPPENGLIEISKEEYYKASQVFFQRQRSLQMASLNQHSSSSDISESPAKSTNRKGSPLRPNDWNDVGLPLPTPNSDQIQGKWNSEIGNRLATVKMTLESRLANERLLGAGMDKSSSCSSSLQSFQMNSTGDQEIKFKLSSKVRTYKKPKNGQLSSGTTASDTSSSDIVLPERSKVGQMEPNQLLNGANGRPRELSENGSVSEEGAQEKLHPPLASGTSSAPYYYSDLLTEEQKAALQKKLCNFASPPPLLSRCTTTNSSTRYLGMTSLNLKAAKMAPKSGEKQLTDTGNHSAESNCLPTMPPLLQLIGAESNENEANERLEMCHRELHPKVDFIDSTYGHQLESQLVNGQCCPPPSHSPAPFEAPIYENYDTVPTVSLCPPPNATIESCLAKEETKVENSAECTSLDDYFGQLKSTDCLDSIHEFNSKAAKKRKVKRKSREDLNVSDSEIHCKGDKYSRARSFKYSKRMCVSAAEFVGKSNEELILMLIQLRRRQSELSKSCEKLRLQMESEATMMELEPHRREEYGYRVRELKQQLNKVESEYASRIGIIESIDSMIKVKSKDKNRNRAVSTSFLDQVTNVRSDSEETESDLSKVQHQLVHCHLSGDMALSSTVVEDAETPNKNIENLKKQQKVLAGELDRVRGLLTHSTKRLEEKAVENAQMEHEMLIARNKLKQVLETEQEAMEMSRSSKLEDELAHINKVIDDLHSRRQELNTAIENLKQPEKRLSDGYLPIDPSYNEPLAILSESLPASYQTSLSESGNIEANLSGYRELMLRSERIPLYENISSGRELPEESETSGRMIFDQVNNNLENTENDEFFTLNINLNKTTQYKTTLNQESSLPSEINNNDSQHNLNSMCEFDPASIHMAYGDSIVDQQIKQIYNYQTSASTHGTQKPAEIKTVREVKRESERRKVQQQQQSYNLRSYRSDRPVANGNGSTGNGYYSNHYYTENQELLPLTMNSTVVTPEGEEFDLLPAYDTSYLMANLSQVKMQAHSRAPGEEISRSSYTTPDIVQSTIKYGDDF